MIRCLWPLTTITVALFVFSCGKQNTSTTEPSEKKSDTSVVLSDSFHIFLGNFPLKPLPAKFPTNAQYQEGELKRIDNNFTKKYLSGDLFPFGIQDVYYHSSLEIHKNLHSVVIFQIEETGNMNFALVNYDAFGNILNSKTIAQYSNGGGMTKWSGCVIENEKIQIENREVDRTSDYEGDTKYSYIIKQTGAILPVVPKEFIKSFHKVIHENGEYMIASVDEATNGELQSEVFEFFMKGDTVIFRPNFSAFVVSAPDEYFLIVNSFTNYLDGYSFTLKDQHNKHEQSESLSNLSLVDVYNQPGAFELYFTPSSIHEGVISAPKIKFVVDRQSMPVYKIKKH